MKVKQCLKIVLCIQIKINNSESFHIHTMDAHFNTFNKRIRKSLIYIHKIHSFHISTEACVAITTQPLHEAPHLLQPRPGLPAPSSLFPEFRACKVNVETAA